MSVTLFNWWIATVVVDQETCGRRGILGCLAPSLNCFKIMLLFFFLGVLPDDRVWIILPLLGCLPCESEPQELALPRHMLQP